MTHNEFVKDWATFLRENPDKQGEGCLRAGDKMCCLGAGLHVLGIKAKPTDSNSNGAVIHAFDGMVAFPNYSQKIRMGLRAINGEFQTASLREDLREKAQIRDEWISLSQLNDAGCPWPVIADIIESRPEGMFADAA